MTTHYSFNSLPRTDFTSTATYVVVNQDRVLRMAKGTYSEFLPVSPFDSFNVVPSPGNILIFPNSVDSPSWDYFKMDPEEVQFFQLQS